MIVKTLRDSEKWTQKDLAKILGWSESTLSRELKRGAVKQISAKNYRKYTTYSARVAQCNIEKNWEKGCVIKTDRITGSQDHNKFYGYSIYDVEADFNWEIWKGFTKFVEKHQEIVDGSP